MVALFLRYELRSRNHLFTKYPMKNSKNKTFFWLCILFILPFSISAFSGKEEKFEEHHARRMKNLTQELKLSNEQQSQVDAIFEQQYLKIQTIHEETRNKMKQVLSSEQMTKMEEMHKRHHGNWKTPPLNHHTK